MPSPSARLTGGGRRQTERSNFSTMTGAMYAAIAGLRTHMQNLNVIGNNVANVNTQGYKAGRSVFRTSIYTTMQGGSDGTATVGGNNPSQIGYGSNLGSVDIDMSTGNYSVTGKTTDMMIDGDGFFLVGDKTIAQNFQGNETDVSALTSLTLTRVGDFDFMADGYLCDSKGNVVYGFLCTGVATQEDVIAGKAAKVGDAMFSDQLVPLRKPRVWKDGDGGMHVGYPRAGGGVQAEVQDANGKVTTPGDPSKTDFDKMVTDAKGKLDDKHILDYGSYKDANGDVVESDYEMASFTNITVDNKTGIITASCGDVGNQIITIGCVAVGTVDNPNGVTQIGNSYFQAGKGSGKLVINTLGGASEDMRIFYVNGSLGYSATQGQDPDGTTNMPVNADNAIDGCRLRSGGTSTFLSGGLEMSKTDLAQEIANMIVTQRGYQANTRIITVTDSMLEELVNMKR